MNKSLSFLLWSLAVLLMFASCRSTSPMCYQRKNWAECAPVPTCRPMACCEEQACREEFAASEEPEECPQKAAVARPGDPEWFPIIAWGTNQRWLPGIGQSFYDEMAECGITVGGFACGGIEEMDMIAKAGMVAYVYDGDLVSSFWAPDEPHDWAAIAQKVVDEYGGHPATYGYWLQDEPDTKRFAALNAAYQELRQRDPDHDIYINLLPDYASPEQLGAPDYEAYVEQFLDEFHPYWLGFDYYSLFEDDAPLRKTYWQNLAVVREAALRHGVYFQYCTLAVGHLPYRCPSEDDLFFEVFSGLTYGAKGIAYFCYLTPQLGNYRNAPIDVWGNKTEVWYCMRRVNNAVRCLAPVLNQLESTAVYHIMPGERMPREDAPGEESLITGLDGNPEANLAVGEFRHRETGETYVMVLNKNLKKSLSIGGLLWRTKPAKVQVVSQARPNHFQNFAGEGDWLAPGHAALLRVIWE